MGAEPWEWEFQRLEAVGKALEGLKSEWREWTGHRDTKMHMADTSSAAKTHSLVFPA